MSLVIEGNFGKSIESTFIHFQDCWEVADNTHHDIPFSSCRNRLYSGIVEAKGQHEEASSAQISHLLWRKMWGPVGPMRECTPEKGPSTSPTLPSYSVSGKQPSM